MAQSSPASQQSGDGGLPGKKIALDLQLADLAMQIVNDLLGIPGRRRPVAARKQLARTPLFVVWLGISSSSHSPLSSASFRS